MRPGLRRFVLVPLIINITIFAALVWVGAHYYDLAMDAWLPEEGWLSYFRWFLWLLFALTYAVILFFGFTLIANLIAAPFNSVLAARVEEKLTGNPPPEDKTSVLKSLPPALASELGKLFYLATRAIPLLVLMLVPGLNVLAGIGWLVFGAWFLALEYGDYPMANYAINAAEQRGRLRQRRLQSLAFGGGIAVMMLVPVLQFAVMPAAVAGATRFWIDDLKSLDKPR
jgi:CysZ protein